MKYSRSARNPSPQCCCNPKANSSTTSASTTWRKNSKKASTMDSSSCLKTTLSRLPRSRCSPTTVALKWANPSAPPSPTTTKKHGVPVGISGPYLPPWSPSCTPANAESEAFFRLPTKGGLSLPKAYNKIWRTLNSYNSSRTNSLNSNLSLPST